MLFKCWRRSTSGCRLESIKLENEILRFKLFKNAARLCNNVSIYFPLLKKDDFFILEFFVGHIS